MPNLKIGCTSRFLGLEQPFTKKAGLGSVKFGKKVTHFKLQSCRFNVFQALDFLPLSFLRFFSTVFTKKNSPLLCFQSLWRSASICSLIHSTTHKVTSLPNKAPWIKPFASPPWILQSWLSWISSQHTTHWTCGGSSLWNDACAAPPSLFDDVSIIVKQQNFQAPLTVASAFAQGVPPSDFEDAHGWKNQSSQLHQVRLCWYEECGWLQVYIEKHRWRCWTPCSHHLDAPRLDPLATALLHLYQQPVTTDSPSSSLNSSWPTTPACFTPTMSPW